MRKFLLLLALLMVLPCTGASANEEQNTPKTTDDLIILKISGSNINLRTDAGTEFDAAGKIGKETALEICDVLASKFTKQDTEGKKWYPVLGYFCTQEESYFEPIEQPAWIREDFVRTSAIKKRDAERLDWAYFHHYLHVK